MKKPQIVAAVIVSLGMLAIDASAENPYPGSAPVNIVSPLPLPVTGNVNIVNPLPLPVTGNVSVSGGVTVAPQEPFQTGTVPTGFSGTGGSTPLIVVPAGKRLVIEGVSANVNASAPGGLTTVSIALGNDRVNELVCRPVGESGNGLNHWFQCSTQVKLYAGPGETVNFNVFTVGNSGGFYRAFASGYYVPVP